jgi:hypothetical protein
MKKFFFALVACIMLGQGIGQALADDIDISNGPLTNSYLMDYSSRLVVAKNNGHPLSYLTVECGFYEDNRVLASSSGIAQNIAAGQTVYINVMVFNAKNANRTDCRISNAIPANSE